MATKYVSSLTGEEMDAALIDMAYHNSEAYAVGTRNGVPVGSSDVTYHNNSKYWAEQVYGYTDRAEDAANRAEAAVPSGTAGAVFFDRAQTLTSAEQAQARANIMAGGSNRNLLDNGWFRVNQRSATSGSGTTASYIADRWTVTYGNGGVTWSRTDDTITIASTNGVSHGGIAQRMEKSLFDYLVGKIVTVSVMLENYSIVSKAITFNSGSAPTIGTDTDGNSIVFRAYQSSTFQDVQIWKYNTPGTFRAVKLELGSVSTLANDVPPEYGTELLKCQYYAAPLEYTTYSNPFTGLASSATEFFVEAYLPRSMREISNPTISVTGTAYAIRNGSTGAITAWDAGAIKGNHIRLKGTTTNLTANTQVPVYTASNTLKIFVSADL